MNKTLFAITAFLFSVSASFAQQVTVVTENAPPLQYIENGKVAGVTTEIIRATLKHAGIESDINVYPWARAFKQSQMKPNTLIYPLIRTPDREEKFIWLGEILTLKLGFVRLSKNTHIKVTSLKDAHQYQIGVMRFDFTQDFLDKNNFKVNQNYIIAKDIPQLLKLLYADKIDMFIADFELLQIMAISEGYDETKITSEFLLPDQTVSLHFAANINSDKKIINRLKKSLGEVLKSK
jgi:polar amino acid transport system substrate-binding protein